MMMNQSQAPSAPSGAGKAIIHARMNIGDTVLIACSSISLQENPQRLHLSFCRFGARGGEGPQSSCGGRGDLYADGGDVLCDSLQPATGPVWRVMVDHSRTTQTRSEERRV